MYEEKKNADPVLIIGQQNEIQSLYILRALLACGILAYHLYWLPVGFGQTIMESFFALSGFLVTKSLFSTNPPGSYVLTKKSILAFWFRRVRRLGLGLWVFVFVSICVSYIIPNRAISSEGYLVGLTSPFFVSNYLTIYGVAKGSVAPYGGLWSLAIEEQFYLLLPVLVLAIGWISKWRDRDLSVTHIIVSLLLIFAMAIILRINAYLCQINIVVESYSIQYRMAGFAIGCVSYLSITLFPMWVTNFLQRWNPLIVFTLILGIFLCSYTVEQIDHFAFLLQWSLAPVLFSLLCIVLFVGINRPLHLSEDMGFGSFQKGIAYIGKTSYSLYLYHPLIIFIVGGLYGIVGDVIAFIISILAGIVSYEYVEKRMSAKLFSRIGAKLSD